ncbi:MAG TPA: hypothetical protein VGS78_16515 [Candidatus Sulfotelmatobacter sp.]|nr:hypothetical protein [Candidatus Sulfotelmatobacter sp.]
MRIIARVTPNPGDPEIVIAQITRDDHPMLLKDAKEFINKNHMFSKDVNDAHVAHPSEKATPKKSPRTKAVPGPETESSVFVGVHMPACNVVGCCVPETTLELTRETHSL